MRKSLNLLFVNNTGYPFVMDKTATVKIDINKELRNLMTIKKGDFALLKVIMDDFNDKEEPFTVELANKVIAKQVEGVICIKNEIPVTILHTNVNDKYPILGLTADGRPCQWDAEGNCADGDPDKKLYILVHLDEKDPSMFRNPKAKNEQVQNEPQKQDDEEPASESEEADEVKEPTIESEESEEETTKEDEGEQENEENEEDEEDESDEEDISRRSPIDQFYD